MRFCLSLALFASASVVCAQSLVPSEQASRLRRRRLRLSSAAFPQSFSSGTAGGRARAADEYQPVAPFDSLDSWGQSLLSPCRKIDGLQVKRWKTISILRCNATVLFLALEDLRRRP